MRRTLAKHLSYRVCQPFFSRRFAIPSQRYIHVSPSSSRSSSSQSSLPPPLFRLDNVEIKRASFVNVHQPLSWTIQDGGKDECWAIIGPASKQGGAVRKELIDIVLGRGRPTFTTTQSAAAGGKNGRTNIHPFLEQQNKSPLQAIKLVSFTTRMGEQASSSEFTNYSARYGAIREQDRVTLYEQLMDLIGCPVGLVAQLKLVPDPLSSHSDDKQQVRLFKWKNKEHEQATRHQAIKADALIRKFAPMLLIDDQLLHRPLIVLSNGQTRRARILSSLITGADVVILEEPYSGIDTITRDRLSNLFTNLHTQRRPRIILVLREQDEIPPLITHTLQIDQQGSIVHMSARDSQNDAIFNSQARLAKAGGYSTVLANSSRSIGIGDLTKPPIVSINRASIVYGDNTVLDSINLTLVPGDRLVLSGDNGSGKTTLLALLLGDHPKSFSFESNQLCLFGHARDHPSNARLFMGRKVGHLSPELFNAFPRKPPQSGGLTVGETIASGYDNSFSGQKHYTDQQKQRVWGLLSLFADLIRSNVVVGETETEGKMELDKIRQISSLGFTQLSHGSQAIVLFLRAVISQPALLILDEPFQGMDIRQVQRVREFLDHSILSFEQDQYLVGQTEQDRIKDKQKRQDMAVVLVSHYEKEWPQSFGRLVKLKDGVIVEQI